MTTIEGDAVISVVDGVTVEPSGQRTIILNAAGTAMTTLNPLGSSIWKRLTGPVSLAELTSAVQSQFPEVEADVIAGDVADFIGELNGLGLVALAASSDQPQ